jgi:hypothetical protein
VKDANRMVNYTTKGWSTQPERDYTTKGVEDTTTVVEYPPKSGVPSKEVKYTPRVELHHERRGGSNHGGGEPNQSG